MMSEDKIQNHCTNQNGKGRWVNMGAAMVVEHSRQQLLNQGAKYAGDAGQDDTAGVQSRQ